MTVNCYIKLMEETKYTIEDLSERTGFSIRTIRYYIQEGILDPPPGRGRGGFYFDSHLQRLLKIKSLQDKGFRLAAIQEILLEGKRTVVAESRELWVRYRIGPGLEISVSRDLEDAERRKVDDLVRIARMFFFNGGKNDE